MLNYTATIFSESGSTLEPNMAAIIVATIQLLGSYISVQMVERLGRKVISLIEPFYWNEFCILIYFSYF